MPKIKMKNHGYLPEIFFMINVSCNLLGKSILVHKIRGRAFLDKGFAQQKTNKKIQRNTNHSGTDERTSLKA